MNDDYSDCSHTSLTTANCTITRNKELKLNDRKHGSDFQCLNKNPTILFNPLLSFFLLIPDPAALGEPT
jgi:hypothetical protein